VGEYRNALFIRESLLGKYHEQTGRTYFWIGKSLAKLEEFSEALVAFSRALRIFERVVRKNHKYHKWSILAIENCIEGLNDDDIDVDTYKATLNASIKHEREGDAHRKKGELAKAVAKYRDAIGKLFIFALKYMLLRSSWSHAPNTVQS
jgi:tetratricopeptide (TPR) repeat protein